MHACMHRAGYEKSQLTTILVSWGFTFNYTVSKVMKTMHGTLIDHDNNVIHLFVHS